MTPKWPKAYHPYDNKKNNFRLVVPFAGDNNWIYSKRNKYINIHKVILPSNKIMLMNFVCLCDHDVNISTHGLIQDGTQYVKQNIWLEFIQGDESPMTSTFYMQRLDQNRKVWVLLTEDMKFDAQWWTYCGKQNYFSEFLLQLWP